MEPTINKVRKVVYVAKGFVTGLTDIVVVIRKPDGSLLSPAPVVAEQGEGIYTFSYTPDVVGVYQEKITSVVNGDKAIRSVNVGSVDDADVKAAVDAVAADVAVVEGKVDAVGVQVAAVDAKVDVVGGKVDGVKTVVDGTAAEVTVVNGKVDAIASAVAGIGANQPGGYFA